jgi:hypothetical protein
MSHYTVTLSRNCTQKTNIKTITEHVEYLAKRALGGSRGKNWEAKKKIEEPQQKQDGWVFSCRLEFQKVSGHKSTEAKQWASIFGYVKKAGEGSRFGKFPWLVVDPTTYPKNISTLPATSPKTVRDYGNVNMEIGDHFQHIYDREAQILRIYSAIEAAVASDWTKR